MAFSAAALTRSRAGQALTRPHNWVQLAKFCAVGATGYAINLVVYTLLLGLAGWVRNAPDGTVEAVFEGDPERVDSMVQWCRRGPSGAHVEELEVTPEEPAGEAGFQVR